jgi:hypothetical protein
VTRSPRLLGTVAAPVVAVVLALLLSSCGTPQVGAAAVVGDHRITVAQVQDAYQDIVPLVGQDQQITQAQILNLLILDPFLNQAAAAAGRGVSAQDARLDIEHAGKVDVTKVSNAGLDVWRANLANSALQSGRSNADIEATYQDIGRQLKKAGVHVNPRYGSGLNYTNFSILPDKPNWLVTPAASATPETTPSP